MIIYFLKIGNSIFNKPNGHRVNCLQNAYKYIFKKLFTYRLMQ